MPHTQQSKITFHPANQYSHTVRVGNWLEESALAEHLKNKFLEEHKDGNLLLDRLQRYVDKLNTEVSINALHTHIRFGSLIQLKPQNFPMCAIDHPIIYPALSLTVDEKGVQYASGKLSNEIYELTVAPTTKPCVRNIFRIFPVDMNDRIGDIVHFGQHFRLQWMDCDDRPKWLYSAMKDASLNERVPIRHPIVKSGETNLALGVSDTSNFGWCQDLPLAYTNFFCQHVEKRHRLRYEGRPLEFEKPFIFTHATTNKNLAAEERTITTLCGPEHIVSIQTYTDIYGGQTWKNIWKFGCGKNEKSGVYIKEKANKCSKLL